MGGLRISCIDKRLLNLFSDPAPSPPVSEFGNWLTHHKNMIKIMFFYDGNPRWILPKALILYRCLV